MGEEARESRNQRDRDHRSHADPHAPGDPDPAGERRVGARDRRLQQRHQRELDREPVSRVRRGRNRRRPVGQSMRTRREPDREGRQRCEDEERDEEPLAPGAVEQRDEQTGDERCPRSAAVGVVERRQQHDQRDGGEDAQRRDPSHDCRAEREQRGGAGEDPERIPVTDRDEQAVIGLWAAEVVGEEARPERVEADRGRAEHETAEPALQVAAAQQQQRAGGCGRVDHGPLALVDCGARRTGPHGRAEREYAEQRGGDDPGGVEAAPARRDEHDGDERHPRERERGPAERRREVPAVRSRDGDHRDQRQQQRQRRPQGQRPPFQARRVGEGVARHSAALSVLSSTGCSLFSRASRSVCSARCSATSTAFVLTSRTSPIWRAVRSAP